MNTRLFLSVGLALSILNAVAEVPRHVATVPVPRDAKWMVRHESFNAISKKGEAQLVFLGDSITQGWEGAGKEAWAAHWAELNAANFGIGGDRTEHVLWRLENGNFDGLKPKLVVLMIGTNNTGHQGRPQKELAGAIYNCNAQNTADGVRAILDKLHAKLPDTQVLLLGIFPRGKDSADALRQQNEQTNALIAKYADGKKVHYMDIGQTFLQSDGTLSKEIMPDLLHLAPKGYEMWAQAIKAKVTSLLSRTK
jgi:lysophospholipase L1-like esterase